MSAAGSAVGWLLLFGLREQEIKYRLTAAAVGLFPTKDTQYVQAYEDTVH